MPNLGSSFRGPIPLLIDLLTLRLDHQEGAKDDYSRLDSPYLPHLPPSTHPLPHFGQMDLHREGSVADNGQGVWDR